MEDASDWVDQMFRVSKPRVLDMCRLAGFERYDGRAGLVVSTLAQLPSYIYAHGLGNAICWVVSRHPREVALIIYVATIAYSLPNDIPDVSIWMYASMREMLIWITRLGLKKEPVCERPLTVGIIPDGNRRWGKQQHIGPNNGHFYGSSRVMECIRTTIADGRVGHLIVYVMSYDNIQKRSRKEQDSLLAILRGWVQELKWLEQAGLTRVCVCGEPSDEVRDCLEDIPINPETHGNDPRVKISLLIGYDGRREIQHARGNPAELWVKDDIDGVIRTGGTRRASGFCTYQTGYSEWIFTELMWPDMTPSVYSEYITKIGESVGLQNHGK